MNQETSALVVEMAKSFMSFMNDLVSSWEKAYIRFSLNDSQYGATGSYESRNGVSLIDPFESSVFFDKMNSCFIDLLKRLDKKRGVLLLSIDASFNYEMQYEFQDMGRWKISKMNGGTGIPEDAAARK